MKLLFRQVKGIDRIILISSISLIILVFSVKGCSYSDNTTIGILLFLVVIYFKNKDYIKKGIYGEQYEIMLDIKKIKKDNKNKNIEQICDIITEYYEKNIYSKEQYLSRYYEVDTEYKQLENMKYGLFVWIITIIPMELLKDLFSKAEDKKDFLYIILSAFIAMILIMLILFLVIKIVNFFYFRPSKRNVTNKFTTDKEKEILSKKIKELA